jgi:peptide/nickel transport system permease protein
MSGTPVAGTPPAPTASPLSAPVRRADPNWLQRALRSRMALPALVILGCVVGAALFANLISPYDPFYQDYDHVIESPSFSHPLGTDDIGRDILSRIIYGSRVSVCVGIVAVAIALLMGIPLGLMAAFFGGWIDDVIMRVIDAMSAFPALLLALAITAALKPGLMNVIVAIGVVYTPQFARLVRGQALAVRELEFVNAARVLGAGSTRLMLRHIWPNTTAPIIVHGSLRVAAAIVTEASLSFLGAGVPLPTPSWGSMLKAAYQYTETAPWMAIFPGAAIFVTVLATNIFGDALRAALDPRMRGRG